MCPPFSFVLWGSGCGLGIFLGLPYNISMNEALQHFFGKHWLMPLYSTERLYWLYIVSALGAAWISFRLYGGAARAGGVKAFLHYCFPAGIYSSASAKIDYFIFLVRPFMVLLVLAPLGITALKAAEATLELLEWGWGTRPYQLMGVEALVLCSLAMLLVFDFAEFLMHYLAHRVWFLWEFHKIHHSAQVLIPFTAYRFHPIDDLLVYSMIGLFSGICQGVFAWWWGQPSFDPYTVMGLHAGVFVFYLAAYNLRHTHIWLSYPKALSHVLISPAQHQIHHSKAQPHWDKNMGHIFAFWDWMFGTLYVPSSKEDIVYGLAGDEDEDYQSPKQMYVLPFIKIYRRYQRWAEAGANTRSS